MSQERRFGVALFVLALGNGMLAFGNLVAGGETTFVALEAFMALVMAGLAYSFVYGESELSFGESRERLVTALTVLIAGVGVVLSVAGFAIAVAL